MTIGKLVVAASAIALLGTLPVSAQTTVDDFKSGRYSVAIRSGEDVNVQPGTMMGSYRYTRVIVGDEAANPRGGAGVLDIMAGGDPEHGYFVVSGGYRVYPRIEVLYGVDARGELAPLHQNLAALGDRFRLHFDGSDSQVSVIVEVFTNGVYAIHADTLVPNRQPSTMDFNFADFAGDVDWQNIDYIALIVQSNFGSEDWALTKIEIAQPELDPIG
jgi:hypothetical protein